MLYNIDNIFIGVRWIAEAYPSYRPSSNTWTFVYSEKLNAVKLREYDDNFNLIR